MLMTILNTKKNRTLIINNNSFCYFVEIRLHQVEIIAKVTPISTLGLLCIKNTKTIVFEFTVGFRYVQQSIEDDIINGEI